MKREIYSLASSSQQEKFMSGLQRTWKSREKAAGICVADGMKQQTTSRLSEPM